MANTINLTTDILLAEPLETANRRHAFEPCEHRDIYDMLKKAHDVFWIPDEISAKLTTDTINYQKLDTNTKQLIEYILAFFAVSDSIVNQNIEQYFSRKINVLEVVMWYNMQEAMEDIHNITYSNLVLAYAGTGAQKLLDSVANYPTIAAKVGFIQKHMVAADADTSANQQNYPEFWRKQYASPLAKQIFINAIMEGLFFSGSFCVIFWINHIRSGELPALAQANEFISRDEGMHAEFAIYLYVRHIVHKLSESAAHAIVNDAVAVEMDFIAAALPIGLPGMNKELMSEYIKYVADNLLSQLGYQKLFNARCPFSFMLKQSVSQRMTDFFMHTPTEYGQSASGNAESKQLIFDNLDKYADD